MSPDKVEEKLGKAKNNLSNDSSITVPYPNQTLIVIGFTGPLGSGCSYISQALAEKLGYKYYKPSDIIREYVDADEKNNVEVLQDKGNELREKEGPFFLIREIWKKFEGDCKNGQVYEGLIIDGIKNEEEVHTLRLVPNFFLFSVHADKEKRCKRLIVDDRFADEKRFEENKYGQQVKKCDYLSDIIILNNENIPKENLKRKSEFIDNVFWRHIEPIKNYAMERKTVPTPPDY